MAKRKNLQRMTLRSIILSLSIICLGMAFFLIWGGLHVPPNKVAQKIVRTCNNEQKYICFLNELSALAEKKDLVYVQGTISEMQKIDTAATDCHLIAHYVASIELKKNPSLWKETLLQQDPDICLGGYFHGILEEYFRQNGTRDIDKELIQNLCSLFKEDQRKVSGCVHIMGHIILVQEKGDIDKSLKICDQLPIDSFPFRCYNGVFMENTTKFMLKDHGIVSKILPATEEDVLRMENYCRKLKREEAIQACWEEAGRLYMQFYKNDIAHSLEKCNILNNEENRYRCGSFVIVQWITMNHTIDPKILSNLCNNFTGADNSWKNCTLRVGSLMLNVNIQYAPIVIEMCNNIPQNFQEGCFRNIAYNIFESLSSQKKEMCDLLPVRYQEECE